MNKKKAKQFHGKVYDFQKWDRALTEDEIERVRKGENVK